MEPEPVIASVASLTNPKPLTREDWFVTMLLAMTRLRVRTVEASDLFYNEGSSHPAPNA